MKMMMMMMTVRVHNSLDNLCEILHLVSDDTL